MEELTFNVIQEEDGGYSAVAVGENIYTQGDTWDELRAMVQDAVACHFLERTAPKTVRLQLQHVEVLAVA